LNSADGQGVGNGRKCFILFSAFTTFRLNACEIKHKLPSHCCSPLLFVFVQFISLVLLNFDKWMSFVFQGVTFLLIWETKTYHKMVCSACLLYIQWVINGKFADA